MDLWIAFFVASTALAAAGFVVVAALWLKKVRDTFGATLTETMGQKIRNDHKVEEMLTEIRMRQRLYEQRLQTLTEANVRMRQDLNALTEKAAHNERDDAIPRPQRILH